MVMVRGTGVKLGLFIGLEIGYGVAGVNIIFGVIWNYKWEVIKILSRETIK